MKWLGFNDCKHKPYPFNFVIKTIMFKPVNVSRFRFHIGFTYMIILIVTDVLFCHRFEVVRKVWFFYSEDLNPTILIIITNISSSFRSMVSRDHPFHLNCIFSRNTGGIPNGTWTSRLQKLFTMSGWPLNCGQLFI